MSSNFYYVKVVAFGDAMSLKKIKEKHLLENEFSLDSIIKMPQELDMEFNNLVETGFDALYGEWQKISMYWMFKEPAGKLGYPFPLESRDQIINCLRSFDCADKYLVPGRQYKENFEKYGHGTRVSWREKNWGTRSNVEGVKMKEEEDAFILWFVSDTYPRMAIKKLSGTYPELDFAIMYVDEYKRNGQRFFLKNGKEIEKQKILEAERSNLILEYEIA